MAKTWTAKEVERIMLLGQGIVSLNEPVLNGAGDDMETEIGDLLEDPEADVETAFFRKIRTETILNIINTVLNAREADIVKRRFGFSGKCYTLEELGEEMCLTRERVRQIEARAIRKLKAYFRRKKIMEDDI